MIRCIKCGAELEPEALFCSECGHKVEPVQSEPAFEAEPVSNIPVAESDANQDDFQSEPVIQPEDFSGYTGPVNTTNSNNRTSNNKNMYIIGALALVIVILIGVIIWFASGNNGSSDHETPETPVIGQENSDEEDLIEEEELTFDAIDTDRLESIIAGDDHNADISVCVIDMKTGARYMTDNATDSMSASAMVNIPIMYTVANDMKEGYLSWDTMVDFYYTSYGRGSIKKDRDGDSIELEYLLEQMMNYSDNNVTNSLMDYFSMVYINSMCNQHGFGSVDIQRHMGESSQYKDNYISASDCAEMLAEIYNTSEYLDERYLTSNFKIHDSVGNSGIGKGLPSDAVFLNHNAVTDSIYNEVAIVKGDSSEYVICVLCNNGKMASSSETVSEISEYVYSALQQ